LQIVLLNACICRVPKRNLPPSRSVAPPATRAAKSTDNASSKFELPAEWKKFYVTKYYNSRSKYFWVPSSSSDKVQCGCQKTNCFTKTSNTTWCCGHCQAPMRSSCVHDGNFGVCRECFKEIYADANTGKELTIEDPYGSQVSGKYWTIFIYSNNSYT
jgi:hypothetical protein